MTLDNKCANFYENSSEYIKNSKYLLRVENWFNINHN